MNYLVEGTVYFFICLAIVYLSNFLGNLVEDMIDKMKERKKINGSIDKKIILKNKKSEKRRA